MEKEIERMEARAQELTAALSNEENYRNGSARELSAEYESVSTDLEAKYTAWERVCEQIAAIE
jgi:hypothetical protein